MRERRVVSVRHICFPFTRVALSYGPVIETKKHVKNVEYFMGLSRSRDIFGALFPCLPVCRT